MTIQINTDKTINGDEKQIDFFKNLIEEELDRFKSQITRIEVHLKDENGTKDGVNDITCHLEARLEGLQPIGVTNHSNSVHSSLEGAISKIKTSIETIIGKNQNH